MNIKSLVNLKTNRESYILIWSIIIILNGIFLYNIESILPEKYFYDSYSIINAIKIQDYSHFGTSYKITERDQLNLGYNIILEENDYSNSYEYAISLKRQVTPKLNISLGYMYSDRGHNNDDVYTFTELRSHQVGVGGESSIKENILLGFGVGVIDYKSKSTNLFNSDIGSTRSEKILGLSLKVQL